MTLAQIWLAFDVGPDKRNACVKKKQKTYGKYINGERRKEREREGERERERKVKEKKEYKKAVTQKEK